MKVSRSKMEPPNQKRLVCIEKMQLVASKITLDSKVLSWNTPYASFLHRQHHWSIEKGKGRKKKNLFKIVIMNSIVSLGLFNGWK